MRVIITGSRNWVGEAAVELLQHVLGTLLDFASGIGQELQLVHGGCPTGADEETELWAGEMGLQPTPVVFRAWWDQYGKAAGPRRNQAMAEAGADLCIAFVRDDSAGTRDMITRARKSGIPTFEVQFPPDREPAHVIQFGSADFRKHLEEKRHAA